MVYFVGETILSGNLWVGYLEEKIMKSKHLSTAAVSILMAATILLTSCASHTTIRSVPSGANLYLDSEPVGKTPYRHSDTKIVGSTIHVRLEKEGYEPLITTFSKNEEVHVGAVIGGLFFFFPYLWIMKYKHSRIYELQPSSEYSPPDLDFSQPEFITDPREKPAQTKADRLRELKQWFEEGLITEEEYKAEKKKILEEDD